MKNSVNCQVYKVVGEERKEGKRDCGFQFSPNKN